MLQSIIPFLVIGMLAYMFWRTGAQMRRDRVLHEREATRGVHAFTPKHRLRFLLNRAFGPQEEEPRWQQELRGSLERVSPKSRNN